jgi:hypothetical protein
MTRRAPRSRASTAASKGRDSLDVSELFDTVSEIVVKLLTKKNFDNVRRELLEGLFFGGTAFLTV